jgi:hypothetical protein
MEPVDITEAAAHDDVVVRVVFEQALAIEELAAQLHV